MRRDNGHIGMMPKDDVLDLARQRPNLPVIEQLHLVSRRRTQLCGLCSRTRNILPKQQSQRLARSCYIRRRKEVVDVRVDENQRPIFMRLHLQHAAIRPSDLVGNEELRHALKVVVRAHGNHEANVGMIMRISGRHQSQSASETDPEHANLLPRRLRELACGNTNDVDGMRVNLIIGKRRQFRSKHPDSAPGKRTRKRHKPRLVNPEMMNAMHH